MSLINIQALDLKLVNSYACAFQPLSQLDRFDYLSSIHSPCLHFYAYFQEMSAEFSYLSSRP